MFKSTVSDILKPKGYRFLIPILLIILSLGLLIWQKSSSMEKCLNLGEKNDRFDCYKELVEKTLKKDGVQEAFGVVKELYKQDASFAISCHEFTHLIGEEVYVRFRDKSQFEVVPETYYCGYGFYHGFIIKLMSSGDDLSLAQEFCTYTDDKVLKNYQVASLDCYHGIGHGVTDYNAADILASDKEQILIENSISLCKGVSLNKDHFRRCTDGVFHSIGDIYSDNLNGITLEQKQDPTALCKRQTFEYKHSCYSAMGYFVIQSFEGNFGSALVYSSKISEVEYAKVLIRPMAGYRSFSTLSLGKNKENIETCLVLNRDLAEECIKGLIEGLSDFSAPDKEPEEVARFCEIEGLPTWVEDFCLDHAVEYFGSYFGEEKKAVLCSLIGSREECDN